MKYIPISRARLIASLNASRSLNEPAITDANINNIYIFEDNLPIKDSNADQTILMIEITDTGE